MGRTPVVKVNNAKQKENPDFIESRELNTPVYEKAEFVCPDFFNETERKEWAELVELIRSIKNGAVTDADRKCMIIRVQAWVEYLRFDADIKKRPDIYLMLPKKDKDGNTIYAHVRNINYDLRKKAADTVLKCDGELGITPVSRARIGLARAKCEVESADNVLSGLLNRKGDND